MQKISRENLESGLSTKSVNFSQQQGVTKKLVKQDKQPSQYHGGSRHLPPSLDRIGMVEAAIRRRSSAPGPDGQEDCVGLWQKAAAFAASTTDACVPATLDRDPASSPSCDARSLEDAAPPPCPGSGSIRIAERGRAGRCPPPGGRGIGRPDIVSLSRSLAR